VYLVSVIVVSYAASLPPVDPSMNESIERLKLGF
jgi:hypothetical protein